MLAVPFLLIGGLLVEQAIFGQAQDRSVRFGLAGFGAVVLLLALLVIAVAVTTRRAALRRTAMQAQHPDEPWLWDDRWTTGRIRDTYRLAAVFTWLFAFIWNLIAVPAAIQGVNEARHGSPGWWFILILPLLGLLLLFRAIYLTLRRMKFGPSELVLETRPGCIGGWFAGTVETRAPIESERADLTLECIHRETSGSGKTRHTFEDVVWDAKQTLIGRMPQGRLGGGLIPIAYRLPAKLRATEAISPREEFYWRLRVRAATPGADYAAEFIVPVFHARITQEEDFIPTTESLAARLRESET